MTQEQKLAAMRALNEARLAADRATRVLIDAGFLTGTWEAKVLRQIDAQFDEVSRTQAE